MGNSRTKKNKTEQLISSIIGFLKTGPKTRQEIWDHLGGAQAVPKSTLSNVTTELKKRGIINDFKPGEQITLQEELAGYEKLDKTTLNEWLILYAIGCSEKDKVSVKEIIDNYMEICNGERITDSIRREFLSDDDAVLFTSSEMTEKMYSSAGQTIRYYLESKLVPAGLVDKHKAVSEDGMLYDYSLSNAAPIIVRASYEQLEQYIRFYHLDNVESTSDMIAERIKILLWGREASDDRIQFVSGKLNHFQQASLRNMDELLKLPYKKKQLAVSTDSGSKKTMQIISVGLLFYSSEINEFYILGRSNKSVALIRMSSIVEMKATDIDNTIFSAPEFHEYLDEMLGIENSKLFDVRIRFKNENSTRIKVESMIAGRRSAVLEQFNNGKELIYTDKVRGLGSLARTLRCLGAGAIVEEPLQLKKMMLRTADRIEDLYMEDENASE